MGSKEEDSLLTSGPLMSINFFDCNTYYDSLMIGRVFILMFAYEIKFYLYTPPGK